jgi:NAD(P)-dependent dehydrogenase (short-subunit alcohol dehydrogenase family)
MMDNRKSIFVTGAASGIGLETARLFAGRGWYVGILDVDEDGLRSLGEEIGKDNCFPQVMDVSDVESVRSAVQAFAEKTGGRMHVLFNNAGIIKFGHFADVDIADCHRIVDINLKGILNCTHSALNYLKDTAGSRIINMASTSAIYGIPDLSVYSATKHAVCAMTEAWDIELDKYGITVSDVLAPFVNTPLLDVSEKVYCIEKMGVDIEPAKVAETVWKAAHGKKLHWKIGTPTYLLMALFWALPFARRYIVKSLTIPPDGK